MAYFPKSRLSYLSILLLLLASLHSSQAQSKNEVKTRVYLSQKIELEPGMVSNKNYLSIDFPRGHIALKSFDAELVDKDGKSAPLYQIYLHHWIVLRYFQPTLNSSLPPIVGNISGACGADSPLNQYFGLGSETRKTLSYVPDPYGIVVGNPSDAPAGYEEKWLLNVHAIDTRGVTDKLGCLECACDLYNMTTDADGQPLPPDYYGGLSCCRDETRCRLKEGNNAGNRTYYLKYTVKYLDYDTSIVPVGIYILDATDIVTKANSSQAAVYRHDCQVEYQVKSCSNLTVDKTKNGCIDTKSVSFSLPRGGNFVYGVGHLHVGGLGIYLYGQGGRDICKSIPIYGRGHKPGNEAGYVVGMSTCYPERGSLKINDGETLTLVSEYNSVRRHAGVMGLFYFLLADS